MSRPGLTQEQVIEAANVLVAAGHAVSVHAVRTALGVGSYTTISQHLRGWREQHRIDHAPSAAPVPPELEALASKFFSSIWHSASGIARRELEAIRHAAHAQVEDTRQEFDQALQEITRLEDQIEQIRQQTAEDARELNRLRNALAQSQAERDACVRRDAELLTQITEIKADLVKARTISEQKVEESAILRGELGALKAMRTERKSRLRGPETAVNG